jgi:hypothetical protein
MIWPHRARATENVFKFLAVTLAETFDITTEGIEKEQKK